MSAPTPKPLAEKDDRLSQLIKLKRLERPDDAFWEAFQAEFRSKQLSSFVRINPWHARLARKSFRLVRKFSLPSAAVVTALAIGTIGVTYYGSLASSEQSSGEELAAAEPEAAAPSEPLFVVESTESSNASESQALPYSPSAPSAIYQVSVMAKPVGATPYQLLSSPVILSPSKAPHESQSASPAFGAKVIKSGRQF